MAYQRTEENTVRLVTSADSPYSATLHERIIAVDCSSGAVTVNLPATTSIAGKRYDVKKIDSTGNAVTITPNGSDKIDGRASRTLRFQWQTFGILCRASGVWILTYEPTKLPPGFLNGLGLMWSSATVISVAAGACRNSDDTFDIALDSADSATITTAGDRDFTPAVNQWVHVYVIADSTFANATRAFLSTSDTAPTLPSGYDKFRRVGSARCIVASTFLHFIQTGVGRERRFAYDEERAVVQALAGGNATGYTPLSLAPFVPPTSTHCELVVTFDTTTATDVANIRPTGSAVVTPTTFFVLGVAAPTGITAFVEMLTNASQSIDYKVSLATNNLGIFVQSYFDEL